MEEFENEFQVISTIKVARKYLDMLSQKKHF